MTWWQRVRRRVCAHEWDGLFAWMETPDPIYQCLRCGMLRAGPPADAEPHPSLYVELAPGILGYRDLVGEAYLRAIETDAAEDWGRFARWQREASVREREALREAMTRLSAERVKERENE